MKVFFLRPNEGWIVDQFADEFAEFSRHSVSFDDPESCDVIWLAAEWCSNRLSYELLGRKPVLCTVHHKVPWKFGADECIAFTARDKVVDMYHVPCRQTLVFPLITSLGRSAEERTRVLGYWFDSSKWPELDRNICKKSLGISQNKFVIGSFQRDSEGNTSYPKLEKGPDLLVDLIESFQFRWMKHAEIVVLLNNFRREYVKSRLSAVGIDRITINVPLSCFKNGSLTEAHKQLSVMYSACDLYVVTSRYEGGPMALLECAAKHVPVISTDVGMASEILAPACINAVNRDFCPDLPRRDQVDHAYKNVQRFEVRTIINEYDDMLEECFRMKRK